MNSIRVKMVINFPSSEKGKYEDCSPLGFGSTKEAVLNKLKGAYLP